MATKAPPTKSPGKYSEKPEDPSGIGGTGQYPQPEHPNPVPQAPPEVPSNPAPKPEDEPSKPVPQEMPPAQPSVPEIEPYEPTPAADPGTPQPMA